MSRAGFYSSSPSFFKSVDIDYTSGFYCFFPVQKDIWLVNPGFVVHFSLHPSVWNLAFHISSRDFPYFTEWDAWIMYRTPLFDVFPWFSGHDFPKPCHAGHVLHPEGRPRSVEGYWDGFVKPLSGDGDGIWWWWTTGLNHGTWWWFVLGFDGDNWWWDQ